MSTLSNLSKARADSLYTIGSAAANTFLLGAISGTVTGATFRYIQASDLPSLSSIYQTDNTYIKYNSTADGYTAFGFRIPASGLSADTFIGAKTILSNNNNTSVDSTTVGFKQNTVDTFVFKQSVFFGVNNTYKYTLAVSGTLLGSYIATNSTSLVNGTAVGYRVASVNTNPITESSLFGAYAFGASNDTGNIGSTSPTTFGAYSTYNGNSFNTYYTTIGFQSDQGIYSSTNSGHRTCIGFRTYYANGGANSSATTSYSTNIGNQSLYFAASTESNNTTIGNKAGRNITTATNNVLIGNFSFEPGTTGGNSVVIAYQGAMNIAPTRSSFTFIGTQAGLGDPASPATNSMSSATSIGYQAYQGYTAPGTASNVAIGYQSSFTGSTITRATHVGYKAGYNQVSSSAGQFIGDNVDNSTTSGSRSGILIGSSVTWNAAAGLVLGSSSYYVATNGGATTYYSTASGSAVSTLTNSAGFIRLFLNGTAVKIPVYRD